MPWLTVRAVLPVSNDFRLKLFTHLHNTHTHTRLMALFPGLPMGQYQKGKTNLDFTGARDSEWQWHQLDHIQVCTSLQTDNHAGTPPLSSLQAGCPSCLPSNSVKALKAISTEGNVKALKAISQHMPSHLHNT